MARIQDLAAAKASARQRRPDTLRKRLLREVAAREERSISSELAIGVLTGLVAVAIRFALPIDPQQLPTLPVVVMLAIVTTFVGPWAGIATAVVGGVLSWYLFFNPYSWSLQNGAWIPLLGFAIIASVIVTTAQLYRSAERRSHQRERAELQAQADNARFFAKEMAHRTKNMLSIVQAIAFQTIGIESDQAEKFAARLKTLANANELLNEHLDQPSAHVGPVIEAALSPFRDLGDHFEVDIVDAPIPAQQVVSLALSLHELATNAVKYGALSEDRGRVRIQLQDDGDRLIMLWKESGGPPVEMPNGSGFGTRLLRRAGLDARLDFEPDGLCCSMSMAKLKI